MLEYDGVLPVAAADGATGVTSAACQSRVEQQLCQQYRAPTAGAGRPRSMAAGAPHCQPRPAADGCRPPGHVGFLLKYPKCLPGGNKFEIPGVTAQAVLEEVVWGSQTFGSARLGVPILLRETTLATSRKRRLFTVISQLCELQDVARFRLVP